MPTVHPFTGRPRLARLARLATLALGLTAASGMTACTSGGSGTTAGQTPSEVTVTRTTTAPATTDSGITSPTASSSTPPPGAATATPSGATTGGAAAPAGKDQAASGLPTCQPSWMRITISPKQGGAAMGSYAMRMQATNIGTSQCVTQGYPGVALVAAGTGKQLGAAADRDPVAPGPMMRLEPGKTAVSQIRVSQAANYGPTCGLTQAAGFRVYLPGTTAAAYLPYAVAACAAPSVHLLEVQPFTS